MNKYKPLDALEITKIVQGIERDIYKNQLLIGSCEAKLKRIEPLSEEYNETIELIDKTYDSLSELQMLRLKAVYTGNRMGYQNRK